MDREATDPPSHSFEPDFKLGDWWIRPQQNTLELGDRREHVEARSMQVLVCLARQAPAVASKKRLLEEVWRDSPFISEEVITHAVWELRKALADSARSPEFIETIPRIGYRLIKDVIRSSGSPIPMEGVRVDHYEIQQEVGRGSMGVVYKAFDRRLHRTVAVKFLAPELTRDLKACQRFAREARLAASVEHPNLATVYEIGETAHGGRYLVTAFYERGSLKARLQRGPLSASEAVNLVCQLCAGLEAAHSRDIVHRDIKPANLLLDEFGTLKIADFGIAKLINGTDLTGTGAGLGTPAYKSPEQSRGQEVDRRTDLWSAGVVLFELLTGRRPFDGEYDLAVVHSILTLDPKVSEVAEGGSIPGPLRRIVAKALAKEPDERFQSAQEMKRALESVQDGVPLDSPAPPPRRVGLRPWLVIALAAVVLWLGAMKFFDQRDVDKPVSRQARDHLEQAKAHWLRGNYEQTLEEARHHFERAVEVEPQWAGGLAHYGVFLSEMFALREDEGLRTEAQEFLDQARRLDPGSPLVKVGQARLDILAGRHEAAETLLRQAIAQEPECDQGESCDLAYVWLGEVLAAQKRFYEAEDYLTQGTGVGDGRIRCHLKAAQILRKRGLEDEAMVQYKEVLSWMPDQTTALHDLAILLLNRGEYFEAASRYRQLYELTGEPMAALNLGHALYGRKSWQEAIHYYQSADQLYLEQGTIMPTTAISLGDVYLETGDVAAAAEWFQEALDRFDRWGPDARLTRKGQRAVCLAKLGRLAEAERAIAELLPRAESTSILLVFAARIHALAQDRDKLFEMAARAVAAGIRPHRLLDDAAFIAYRGDQEYQRLLESSGPV